MEREVDHEGSEDMCAVSVVGSHRRQNFLISVLPVSESLLRNCVCLIVLLIAPRQVLEKRVLSILAHSLVG